MDGVLVRRVAVGAVCVLAGAALYLSPGALKDVSSDPVEAPTETSAPSVSDPASFPPTERESSKRPSPSPRRDQTLPTPVTGLRLLSNTATTYTIAWGESTDDSGIRHYVVLINGYLAGKVQGNVATFPWPASTDNILVQVAPVDNNGRQGEWRALMIVPPPLAQPQTTATPSRPLPTPPPSSPTVLPTDSATPTVSASPTSSAPSSTATSSSPTIEPSTTPSPSTPSPSESDTPTPSETTSAPPSTSCPVVTPTATASVVDPSAPDTSASPSASTSAYPTPEPTPSC